MTENGTATKTCEVKLSRLTIHPRNPRTISPARLEQLQRTITAERDMLQARPVIALRDGTVIAGNQRLLAAQALGWDTIPALFVDLDEERATRWMLLDNRAFGDDDLDQAAVLLAELEEAGSDLDLTGFAADEVDKLLRSLRVRPDPDETPPLPAGEPRSVRGEVYELGPHRLMCGDAIADGPHFYAAAKVDCLLTDPPYGIRLDTDFTKRPDKHGKLQGTPQRTYPPVIGDDKPFDAAPMIALFAGVREQFWFGADYYRRSLSSDDHDGSWLVWDKRNEASDTVIGSGFELIWSRTAHKRDLLRFYFNGALGVDARDRVHPTQKPTPLLAEILTRWGLEGCAVADPFAGSGSTLIACEQTDRRCFAMEIDPGYCDVIRDRYEAYVAA